MRGLRAVLGPAAIAKPAINFGALGPMSVARFLQAGRIFVHRMQMLQRGVPDLGPVDAKDVIVAAPPRPGARLTTAGLTGLLPVRTPGEILAVVLGPNAPAGTAAGLLFPSGVNGTIRTV